MTTPTEKAIANALQLALLREGWQFANAEDFALNFVEENAALFVVPDRTAPQSPAYRTVNPVCKNCQQPTNNHLPGCTVGNGLDTRARTENPLPPASE